MNTYVYNHVRDLARLRDSLRATEQDIATTERALQENPLVIQLQKLQAEKAKLQAAAKEADAALRAAALECHKNDTLSTMPGVQVKLCRTVGLDEAKALPWAYNLAVQGDQRFVSLNVRAALKEGKDLGVPTIVTYEPRVYVEGDLAFALVGS